MIPASQVLAKAAKAPRLWLLLDYDGTLAEFAPTPDHILPRQDLIGLISACSRMPGVRVAVISGRRLAHIQRLLPVPGVWLAGTYGVEWQLPGGEQIARAEYEAVRAPLTTIKPAWSALIGTQEGFYLEDKGWSLAIHASDADPTRRRASLEAAREAARAVIPPGFLLLGDEVFLEVKPLLADKGKAVDFLLGENPWPKADIVYFGDDDKDEQAFEAVRLRGGVSIRVGPPREDTAAQSCLDSPAQVHRWLEDLTGRRNS